MTDLREPGDPLDLDQIESTLRDCGDQAFYSQARMAAAHRLRENSPRWLAALVRALRDARQRVQELERSEPGPACGTCGAVHGPDAPHFPLGEPVTLRAKVNPVVRSSDQARVAELEQELETARFVQRYGTPFDPTGAKTGTEIQSLRARVETAEAALAAAAERTRDSVCGFKFDHTVCVALAGHAGPHITDNERFPHGLIWLPR